MAIDLTNNESAKGAIDALKTILRSRQNPIIVEPGQIGKGKGPQLQLPQNVKVRPQPQPKQPQPQQPKTPEDPTKPEPGNKPKEKTQDPTDSKDTQKQDGKAGNGKQGEQENSQGLPGEGGEGQEDKKDPTKEEPSDNPWDKLVDDETEDEKKARIDRINDTTNNQRDLDNIRQDKNLRDGEILRAKQKEKDEIIKATQGATLQDFSSFSTDLFKAISTQIKTAKHKEDTYRRPNPSYAGTNYLVPGKDYPTKKEIPVVAVYFDQSMSWGASDIKRGLKAISSIARFEKQKRVKLKVYFFANHLHDTPEAARWEGGTHGFPEVLKHIANPANKITNAIIITDSDIEYQTNWKNQSAVRVRGCVWFLWGNGRSLTAPKYLKGDRGTFEYSLY